MSSISQFAAKRNTHPLDLVELLTQIAIHLDKPDLASACRVKKHWFEPFASLLWRSIHSQAFYTKGFVETCLKYKHFIRELSCPKAAPILELRLHLTRLTALALPYIRSDSLLFSVIEANKNTLQSLTIEYIQCLDSKIGFETISMLKHLKCLNLTGPRLPLLYVRGIIRQLPVLLDLRLQEEGSFSIEEVALDSGFETLPDVLTLPIESDGSTTLAFGLKQITISSRYGAFHPLLSIAKFCPILESFEIRGNYNTRHSTTISRAVQELAKALRQSCSRLKDLILETWWVGPTEYDYQVLLKGTLAGPATPLLAKDYSSGSLLSPWTGLRSLLVHGQTGGQDGIPECNMVLHAIWEAREALQDTLEEIFVPYMVEEAAIGILCHFKNLRSFDIGEATLPISHLFRESIITEGKTIETIERNIRPWACKNLEALYLTLAHEEEELDWCPEELEIRLVGIYDIVKLTAKFGETYPAFIAIKRFLGRFPKLNQSHILFSQAW